MLIAALEPVDELVDGAGLVTGEIEIRDERETVVDRGHAWRYVRWNGPVQGWGLGGAM